MYEQDTGNNALETDWSPLRTIDLSCVDPNIEKITVKGSDAFTYLLTEELKNSLGNRVVETLTKSRNGDVLAEMSVRSGQLFTHRLIRIVLPALTEALKNESVKMSDTTIISFGKNTLKVEGNVLNAVHRGYEITYIMEYTLSKVVKGEKAKAIANIVEYYHDTCNTYFHKNKLILDRYHYPSENEPLPIDEMYHVYEGAENVLSQYCEVQAIGWQIKATGIEEALYN